MTVKSIWNHENMEFVKKFTPPDFQAKNFTPSISPTFNSFSKEKHRKWVKMEKFTPLAKILHCRRHWRDGQIPPLVLGKVFRKVIVTFDSFATVCYIVDQYVKFHWNIMIVSSNDSRDWEDCFIELLISWLSLTTRACCREVKIPNQYGGVILWCLFMYIIDSWL